MDLDAIKLPVYQELFGKAIGWEYGSLHSHQEIADIMQLRIDTYEEKTKYHSMVTRANKRLIENSKMLVNIRGKGYKVVEPDEYVEMSCKEAKKATKRFRKAYKINDVTPTEKMTPEGLGRYRSYNDRLGVLRAITEGVYKEISTLAKKPLKLNSGRD